MKKRTRNSASGFTIIEVLMALTILAVLMTAVAFAFDASVVNYEQNRGIYQTVNTARQALLRMTNDLRTVEIVALSGDEPNTQISFAVDSNKDGVLEKDVTYRFDAATNTLYYDDNITTSSYVLCNNVTSTEFNRTQHQIYREVVLGSGVLEPIQAVRDVRIVLTVTDETGNFSRTLAAATLIHKNQ